jgi:hypothetical protein
MVCTYMYILGVILFDLLLKPLIALMGQPNVVELLKTVS